MNSDNIIEAIADRGVPAGTKVIQEALDNIPKTMEPRDRPGAMVGVWKIGSKRYGRIVTDAATCNAWDDFFGSENFRGFFYIYI